MTDLIIIVDVVLTNTVRAIAVGVGIGKPIEAPEVSNYILPTTAPEI